MKAFDCDWHGISPIIIRGGSQPPRQSCGEQKHVASSDYQRRRQMTTEIGFGLLGGGMVGAIHAEAIGAIAGARLVAVCGREAERTAAFAARFDSAAYTDYEHFLAHPGLHIVNICTPNGTHAELGCQAAAAG